MKTKIEEKIEDLKVKQRMLNRKTKEIRIENDAIVSRMDEEIYFLEDLLKL